MTLRNNACSCISHESVSLIVLVHELQHQCHCSCAQYMLSQAWGRPQHSRQWLPFKRLSLPGWRA